MDTIRFSIACRAASAFILVAAAAALGGCDDDGDNGRADAATDVRPSGTLDLGSTADLPADTVLVPADAPIADLVVSETAAADGGVRNACVDDTVCYEYETDYTEANISNHCSPQMGTIISVCPADLMGARIGRCVTKSSFGTLHTIYYKRVDPRSAQAMCAAKGGVWYAN